MVHVCFVPTACGSRFFSPHVFLCPKPLAKRQALVRRVLLLTKEQIVALVKRAQPLTKGLSHGRRKRERTRRRRRKRLQ